MARGINKVIIVGNLGQDPETRSFPDGGTVTNISVATSESWRDKQTGQMQDRTEWHRIVLRDRGNFRLGQIAAQYLRKGSKVYIEGALRTRKWQDQQGMDRYTTEIIANEMQMLDSRGDMQQGGQPNQGANPAGFQQNTAPMQQAPSQQQPASFQSSSPASGQSPSNNNSSNVSPVGFDDFDEDIPF